jgi:hypothetical protein
MFSPRLRNHLPPSDMAESMRNSPLINSRKSYNLAQMCPTTTLPTPASSRTNQALGRQAFTPLPPRRAFSGDQYSSSLLPPSQKHLIRNMFLRPRANTIQEQQMAG